MSFEIFLSTIHLNIIQPSIYFVFYSVRNQSKNHAFGLLFCQKSLTVSRKCDFLPNRAFTVSSIFLIHILLLVATTPLILLLQRQNNPFLYLYFRKTDLRFVSRSICTSITTYINQTFLLFAFKWYEPPQS